MASTPPDTLDAPTLPSVLALLIVLAPGNHAAGQGATNFPVAGMSKRPTLAPPLVR